MADVFLVVEEDYDYYSVLQVFADRATADSFVADYNAASEHNHAEVKAAPLRPADWKAGQYLHLQTKVAYLSGEVISNSEHYSPDWESTWEGTFSTSVSQRCGGMQVETRGDAAKVPAAHAEAVAKLQANITGA